MGLIFESVAEQAYYRLRGKFKLPMIKEWGNWEGLDKTGRQIEIDIVARTTDGRMVTGAVKWNSKPVSEGLHLKHVEALQRLADSGHAWAHEALQPDATILYVAAGGFRDWENMPAEPEQRIMKWDLHDIYTLASRCDSDS